LLILHVIPSVAARYGGPSTAIWPMTAALRDLSGINVEIATTDADGPDGSLTAADLPPNAGTIHLFRRDSGESLKYSRGLADWLLIHARDYDVIEVHSVWNYPIFAVRRAARRAGVPYVIRPCGNLSSYTFRKSRWKKQIYWWLRERGNIRQASGFHVTSNDERDEVLRLGVKVPVDVIPLGIGDDAWQTPTEPNWLRQQCPQVGNRPLLLFLSRLHPKKGITDFLLPALAQMRTDAFLAIVGGEDNHAPGFARQVESEIARLGLRHKVALLGAVAPGRRWAAFDGADLFVLPSLTENFGIVVAEAMARGKSVVVTTGVQFAEHVTASQAGAVVRPGAGELAECLDLWLADPSRRTVAGAAGRQYVRNHFTWQSTAVRLADLYRRVSGCRSCAEAS
jgi:glycosyltransferase involved in cell wall biosynthesis